MTVSEKSKKELIEENNALRLRLEELERNEAKLREADELLRESEFQYRTTIDSMRDAIHLVDADLNIILINEKLIDWSKELGLEVGQPVGRNIFDLFPFLPDKVRDEYRRVLDTGKAMTTVEMTQIAGRKIFTESRKIPVCEAGKVVKIITVIRDITSKKLAEDALRESEQKFRSLAEQSPNMIFINKEGRIVYANKKCEEIMGYKREEFYSPDFNFLNLISPQSMDLIKECFKTHMEGREVPPYEYTIISKAGERIDAINSSRLIQYEGGNAILGVITDITERKQQENLTAIQRDLAIKLGAATELECGLSLCLEAAIETSGMDCGGIYLVDDNTGSFKLVVHRGLSAEFTNHVCFYDTDSDNSRLVMEGKPVYMERAQLDVMLDKTEKQEGLSAIAVLPILNEGRIIGCMNVASHIIEEIHSRSRLALETIAAQIGSTVARLEMAEELRLSEERYRSLIANIPDVVWTSDEEGNTTFISENVNDMYGYRPIEIYTQGSSLWFGRIHPDDVEKVKDSYKAVFEVNEQLDIEYRVRRKDGLWLWIRDRSIGAYEKDGVKYADGVFSDITKRKEAEEALRQSEEKFRSAFKYATVGRATVALDGRFIDVNSSSCEILGYSEQELLRMTWMETTHPDDLKTSLGYVSQLKEGKIPFYRLIHRAIRKDGQTIWIDLNVVMVRDSQGEPLYMIGDIIDITEQKQLEEAYRSLVDNSLQGLAIIQDGRMVFLNKAFSSSTGYTEEEMLAASPEQLQSLVHPEDRELVWTRHRDRLAGKKVPPRYEFRFIRKDGSTAWVEIFASEIEYRGLPAIQAAYIDITERKKTEEALSQSEQIHRNMIELAPDAIVVLNKLGTIISCNSAGERVSGLCKDELIGRHFTELGVFPLNDIPKYISLFAKLFKGDVYGPFEVDFIRKDGSKGIVEVRVSMLADGNLQVIATDVKERKLVEQKFLEYRAQLKSLASELSLTEERERHRLATNLHDQISQALVISRIKLQALKASVSSDDIAGPLEEVCGNLDRIIQDTRTLTFDLSSPILYELGFEAAVSEWLEEQITKKHGIKAQFKDDGQPKPLDDDIRILLFRNVRELLINIVKHANAKNVKVTIRRIRQQIYVCVEDDGKGFDHAELASSTGFGIFSIRERLEQLVGHIEIESERGRGTRITMTAPLKCDKISGDKKSKSRKNRQDY